ncbi:MAG: hypothetical protein AAF629_00470 [Chloroflexota bacterium]
MFEFQAVKVIEEQHKDRLARVEQRRQYAHLRSSQLNSNTDFMGKLAKIRHWFGRTLILLGERMLIQDAVCEAQKEASVLR